MSTPLEDILKTHIAQHGPMDIGQYMNMALCHPEHGYYMKQDPFGKQCDFVTAPEISQIFGEIIGAWVADTWMKMGRPLPFGLVECGPGRGTLMSDIMRVTKNVEGFHEACLVHFVEISPALKSVQGEAMKPYRSPHWHQSVGALPSAYPLIIIGNEFMDALPLRQLEQTSEGWMERVIIHDLTFGHRPVGQELIQCIPEALRDSPAGSVFEISPARQGAMQAICACVKNTGGAALIIDYGHEEPGIGDTFQALHNGSYGNVLDHIGDSDLTSHVDFAALSDAAVEQGATVAPIVTQGHFLHANGAHLRAGALIKHAQEQGNSAAEKAIDAALHRLTSPDEMGRLFKVLSVRA